MARRREELPANTTGAELKAGDHISVPGSKLLSQSSEDSVTVEIETIEPMGSNHQRLTVKPSGLVLYFRNDEPIKKITHYEQPGLF